MKKFLTWALLLCCLLCSGCARDESPASEAQNMEQEIIEQGKNYQILSTAPFTYEYVIFDNSGNEAARQSVGGRPLTVSDLGSDLLDISVGMGTGLALHKYYDAANNRFSEEYPYVIAVEEGAIAYIDVPADNPMEGRRVVVQDIFDPMNRHGEFAFDFAKTDMPVIHAEFLNDATQLQIAYYTDSGEATDLVDLH